MLVAFLLALISASAALNANWALKFRSVPKKLKKVYSEYLN
jgi:hypothetical protein